MNANSQTVLNMVIGYPLTHTQSPLLHAAVYQMSGINAVLLAQPHLQLESLIAAIKTLSVKLTAVTLPYKEQVLGFLDVCSPEVSALQAANTIIQRDGKLYGYNTDINGIAFALRDITVEQKNILVLGAGGAARAAGYFLKHKHANIFWMNRTAAKAQQLAREFGGEVICTAEINKLHVDIIINTTPVGMSPETNATPLPDYSFHDQQVVFDMVYNPVNTLLLNQAQKKHAITISGLDMFIGQGLKQIELFTGNRITVPGIHQQLRELMTNNQRVSSS
jgi:shikimate dehydrogenase